MEKVNENIVSGLKTTYCKSAAGAKNRTKVLSVIANEYSNKELKEMFNYEDKNGQVESCTDYEITKARLRGGQVYGLGAEVPKATHCTKTHIIEPEVLSFILDFLHHPDNVQYSSYKTASCEGKSKSWISELLGGGQQPVMWMMQDSTGLYQCYKEECIEKVPSTSATLCSTMD